MKIELHHVLEFLDSQDAAEMIEVIEDLGVECRIWRAIAFGVRKEDLVTKDAQDAMPRSITIRDKVWKEYSGE